MLSTREPLARQLVKLLTEGRLKVVLFVAGTSHRLMTSPSRQRRTGVPSSSDRRVRAGRFRRLREIRASRKGSPVPQVVMVSNYGSLGGGAAAVFRDIGVALREKQPDLDLVAVCPWKGSLAKECARHGMRAKLAFTPWWAFAGRSRTPRIAALIGASSPRRTYPPGHLASTMATCSAASDDGAQQHNAHSLARDRCQTAGHPALLVGPRVWKRRPSASVPAGLSQDRPPDWSAV